MSADNMSHVVVKFSRNWADEFDMKGARLFTKQDWDEYVIAVEGRSYIDCSFGTNEGWEDETPKDWLRSFTVVEVTEEDAEAFKRIFPINYYKVHGTGYFPSKPQPHEDDEFF